jgi:uncharacterized protein YbcI
MARATATRGQLEAEISKIVSRFEKEHMGQGPLDIRTWLLDDMVVVRMRGMLTKAEQHLSKTSRNSGGRELIKRFRIELLETGRPFLEGAIRAVTKRKIRSIHTDISTMTGEKVIIFTLDRAPEVDG